MYGIWYRLINKAGIIICPEWSNMKNGLLNFVKDMGDQPVGSILGIINKDGVYEKSNCEWRVVIPDKHNIILNLNGADITGSVVYKISFNSGMFYIGSTGNFQKRLYVFKGEFKKGYAHNKRLKKELENNTTVYFDIIEIVKNSKSCKRVEDKYLKKYRDDPCMLNRSTNAKNNKGVHWTHEERGLMSIASTGVSRPGRPVKVPNRVGYHYIKIADR
jgi:predicted GIY-YIG superfamily endonuclease